MGQEKQHQGEPVCEVVDMKYNRVQFYRATGDISKPYLAPGTKLYTHADPGDVERLESLLRASRTSLDNCALQIEKLQAMLVERDALLLEIADHCNGCVMPAEQLIRDWGSSIDAALSASAGPAKNPNTPTS